MKREAGFTVVELIITITIMVILSTLAVVNLRSSQAQARDDERQADVANIATYLETIYDNGIPSVANSQGSYPYVTAASGATNINVWFAEADTKNLRAPDVIEPNYSLVPATNSTQTTSGVTPQPAIGTYVYQPLNSAKALCTVNGDCRKFNLYYRSEVTNTVTRVVSRMQ